MTAEKKTPPTKKPRTKWRRILGWLLIPFLLALAINGPIARWLVLDTLDEQLQAQGMQGQAEISGKLTSGFTLSQVSYSGTQGIQSLKIKRLTVHYSILELFDSKLRNISIDQGTAVIDIARFPENPDTGPDPKQAITETLQQIQQWASQPTIDIRRLDVTLLDQDKLQAHITIDALTHRSGSADFALQRIQVSDRTGRSTPTQNIQLGWRNENLTLDSIELLPDVVFKNVQLDWKNDLQAQALLHFLESKLHLNIQDSIDIKLSGGSIDSNDLAKRLNLDIPVSFVLSGMNARIQGWQKKLSDWEIEGSLQLQSAAYQAYQLSNSTLILKQQNQKYSLQLDGQLDSNPVQINVDGSWPEPKGTKAWAATELDYKIVIPKLGSLANLWKDRPEGINLTNAPIQLTGIAQIENEQLIKLTSKGSIQGITADKVQMPPLSVIAEYQHQGPISVSVQSEAKERRAIDLNASLDQAEQTYQASLSISESDPTWINALATALDTEVAVSGPVQLTWSGSGSVSDLADLKQAHEGDLEIEKLEFKFSGNPALQLRSQLSYKWPNNIHLKSLSLQEGEWNASAVMQWDGKRIKATSAQLTRGKELIASLNGAAPYQINIRDTQDFFKQSEPWNLSIKSQPIALTKLRDWFDLDLINPLTGNAQLSIELSGSPKNPEVKGEAKTSEVKGLDDQQLLPLDVALNFHSEDQKLIFDASLLEGKDQRLTAKGSVPFRPLTWAKDADWIDHFISNAPINAEVKIDHLPLARFEKFIPGLKKITGFVTGNAGISGTIEKPIYSLNLDADVPLIQVTSSEIGKIRNIKLNTRIDQTQIATVKLTAQINGGKFEMTGDVDLNDFSKPLFNITLHAGHALIYRSDLISVRANTDILIKGAMDDVTISGTIGIVESLFYKDIELIPIGVPSSAVATVKVPAISAKKAEEGLPIPAPFSDWKLDLTLRTDDPILIRGNVATGNLTGSLKIGGTLSKPLPQGTILANQVKAKLPLSILDIERGQIIFNGRDGLNPSLKIRGTSTVGAYDVNVFVYGPANSPKTTFSSFPPLPESEVMTLLATGTTTSNLANPGVATYKAFQLFLVKLKQRNDKPGGNKLFKALLSEVEDLNINVGEVDPFTGRTFTSSTIEIHPSWHLTAQVDDTQETRGLIVYVLRFR